MSIRIEPWTDDDLPLGQALLGDPVMMEHLGGPEDPDKILKRHRRYVDAPAAFKITVDGVGAGWVGYWEREWQGEQIYEMGWSVLPGFQGRGVAFQGTMLALEAARASAGPRVVHAFPVPGNGPSNAICRKCGFTLLGEVEFEFPKGCWAPSNDWVIHLDERAAPAGPPLAPA